jgi:hypothetical protein
MTGLKPGVKKAFDAALQRRSSTVKSPPPVIV